MMSYDTYVFLRRDILLRQMKNHQKIKSSDKYHIRKL